MDNLKDICLRIKDLREFSDYSVQAFAEKLGLTEADYAAYENGEKDIPIGILYNIASTLMIDPGFILFGKEAEKNIATAVYNGKGTEIVRHPGYSFISLNSDFMDSRLEPMLVTIKEGAKPELLRHKGQEFNYVLKGALRVIVGEKEFFLRAGDSLYFDASQPHAQIAMDKIARFLTVIEK